MSSNLGEQFKSALNEALATGNYEELNTLVADTVNSALGEVGATASKAWQQRTGQQGAGCESCTAGERSTGAAGRTLKAERSHAGTPAPAENGTFR